jgi:hypothetical protein
MKKGRQHSMKETLLYPNLSWHEIREFKKDGFVILQPIGAVEDHAPHLPVTADMKVKPTKPEINA